MFYRDGLSRSEIARRTGLSRNTIKKWLMAPAATAPKYRRESPPGKLTRFAEQLRQALEIDARRPKRDRRTAVALMAELKAQGYRGGYTAVTDFIRAWRAEAGANVPARAFVPLKFELGEAFQFDWSEEGLVIGGIEAKSGNEQSLHKKDSGQLHDSLQWTRNSYSQFADRLQPIIVAKVTKTDADSNFPIGTRVLTQAGCSAMGKALHQLTQKLAQQGPIFATPEVVLAEITNFGLHPDQFLNSHTEPTD